MRYFNNVKNGGCRDFINACRNIFIQKAQKIFCKVWDRYVRYQRKKKNDGGKYRKCKIKGHGTGSFCNIIFFNLSQKNCQHSIKRNLMFGYISSLNTLMETSVYAGPGKKITQFF